MNHHLNLFRFFNESTETEFIENNLSRAFALCLTNNSLFYNEYIRSVVTDSDYEYLFSSISSDTEYIVDVQIDTATIEKENYKTVYAVAMTSDRNINMEDFFIQQEYPNKKNITDIFISIKDIAFVIEVKRTGEDCKMQLFNQVLPFIKEKKIVIIEKAFSWQEVVKILEKVKHVQQLASQNSIFITHFLELSEIRYPNWFEPKPLNIIPFSSQRGTKHYIQLQKRIRQGLASISSMSDESYQLLNDRLGISLPFAWASELSPEFETHPDSIKEYVSFYIWPANTKQQGFSIYSKSLDWTKKEFLVVDGLEYELEISYNIKLSHYMGKYIAGINYYETDVIKLLHTSENFYNQSGKWERDNWVNLEKLLDEHFDSKFNWRKYCKWEDNFLNTDRNYLFMSLGFEVAVYIPFSKFKDIDKKESDIDSVSNFIKKIAIAFQTLI